MYVNKFFCKQILSLGWKKRAKINSICDVERKGQKEGSKTKPSAKRDKAGKRKKKNRRDEVLKVNRNVEGLIKGAARAELAEKIVGL